MCNNILNFEITKNDIDDIFENYNIHDSTERRNFIQNLNNYLEVQAVPGSGKTKILGAKIGLLLKKWKFKNSGICVLTHTNVAKEEILKSCREIDKNCKMGCFPHFIGTIQEFVDRFLGIPYLRSNIKDFELKSINNNYPFLPFHLKLKHIKKSKEYELSCLLKNVLKDFYENLFFKEINLNDYGECDLNYNEFDDIEYYITKKRSKIL